MEVTENLRVDNEVVGRGCDVVCVVEDEEGDDEAAAGWSPVKDTGKVTRREISQSAILGGAQADSTCSGRRCGLRRCRLCSRGRWR